MIGRRALLLAGLASPRALRAAQAPLLIGVPPFLTPSAMLVAFRPLREHLQQRLQRTVEFYTARDFVELLEQARGGAYDISMLPAHLAGLALADWQFLPLAASLNATKVQVLVRNDQSIRRAADLRGRKVGALGQLSLSAATGVLWLRQQQLEPGREVSVLTQSSISSAMLALERGEVDAVVATRSQLDLLPAGQFLNFISLTELADIPAPIYLAKPGTAAATVQAWQQALFSFTPNPNGADTAANAQLHPLGPHELKRLAALRDVAREQLAALKLPSAAR